MKVPEVKQILEKLVWRNLDALLQAGTGALERSPLDLKADIRKIERSIAAGEKLGLGLCLDKSQELYFDALYSQIVPLCLGWLQRQAGGGESSIEGEDFANQIAGLDDSQADNELSAIRQLLELGQTLAVDVECWLKQLS